MKTVAILGGAQVTREAVNYSKADEIWVMNWSYLYDYVPRIDRLFEMHKTWLLAASDKPEYEKPRRHWQWMHENDTPYPIYMLADVPGIKSCVRYPIESVTEDIFGHRLLAGEEPTSLFSSSVDYMLALAIHEQFDVIELYGVEMAIDTEYRYQRNGAHFFIGVAVGRGITVKRPENSMLMSKKRYGYEGSQMIFRQDLEHMLNHWKREKQKRVAQLQELEGRMRLMDEQKADEKDLVKLAYQIRDMRDDLMIAQGAVMNLEYCIREVDLEEPELQLVNPFISIESLEIKNADPNNQKTAQKKNGRAKSSDRKPA